MWLKWLDPGEGDCVRVFAFDFSKAFDSVNHFILFNKELPISPYIVNWIINVLSNRQQRIIADGDTTPFLHINRGMPQGTILGHILFTVMLNDIQAVDSDSSLFVKFADDLTLSVLVQGIQDQAPQQVQNILMGPGQSYNYKPYKNREGDGC